MLAFFAAAVDAWRALVSFSSAAASWLAVWWLLRTRERLPLCVPRSRSFFAASASALARVLPAALTLATAEL